jgi:hypothetical protein
MLTLVMVMTNDSMLRSENVKKIYQNEHQLREFTNTKS